MSTHRFAEDLEYIRHALLIGLWSYGEIERLTNDFDRHTIGDNEVPQELRPTHPNGAPDTVGEFADALLRVEAIHRTLQAVASQSAREIKETLYGDSVEAETT